MRVIVDFDMGNKECSLMAATPDIHELRDADVLYALDDQRGLNP
jgi:hypothetical protein